MNEFAMLYGFRQEGLVPVGGLLCALTRSLSQGGGDDSCPDATKRYRECPLVSAAAWPTMKNLSDVMRIGGQNGPSKEESSYEICRVTTRNDLCLSVFRMRQ